MTTIIGTGGDDRLVGGTGEDIFVFGASHGTDTIWGFTDGEDLIDLRGISGITPKRTSMINAQMVPGRKRWRHEGDQAI